MTGETARGREWWDNSGIAAAVAVALTCALGPWWGVFEMDTDEGVNVMKAALVASGHEMYGEIWSDQPPVLSYLLAGVHLAFGYSVAAARGMVLGFAAALAWGLYRVVRRDAGAGAAWAATLCLVSGALQQRLGVSVLIGLPSLGLAMLALERLTAPGARWRDLLLAGVLTALALQTKLFVLAWLPGLLLAAVLAAPKDRGRRAFAWLAVVAAVFAVIVVGSGGAGDFVDQLVRPHLDADASRAFRMGGGPAKLWGFLAAQPQYLILGAAGLLLAPPGRGIRWVPLVWIAVGAAALWDHHPLWIHQIPLLTVPLAWLAGGVAAGFAPIRPVWLRRIHQGVAVAAIAATLPFAAMQAADTAALFRRAAEPSGVRAVELLERHAAETRWVLTDRPMDAYRAHLLVPPPVAVYTLKRVRTGNLSEDELLAVLRDYAPEQVSYRRLYMGKRVKAYLDSHYAAVEGLEGHALYVLPSLR